MRHMQIPAEVPVNNHPMGYYAEVQTNENPMSVPVDAQGKLALSMKTVRQ